MTLLLVMVGAALGAPSRWLLDRFIQERRERVFPLGTLTINVSGSALLGLLLGVTAAWPGADGVVALAGTGFCGGFTTYSTFGYETIRLVEDGSVLEAALNVVASLVLGLLAAALGWWLGRALG